MVPKGGFNPIQMQEDEVAILFGNQMVVIKKQSDRARARTSISLLTGKDSCI